MTFFFFFNGDFRASLESGELLPSGVSDKVLENELKLPSRVMEERKPIDKKNNAVNIKTIKPKDKKHGYFRG